MKVIIAGGSIGGLGAGLVMRCHGHEISVYEKTDEKLRERGSGISVQPRLMNYLSDHGISTRAAISIPIHHTNYLSQNGRVAMQAPSNTIATSWGQVYQQLYEAFPKDTYHFGNRIVGAEPQENSIVVHLEDGTTAQGDLLIGADGYRSTIRKLVAPEVKPDFAGYIAWRGVIRRTQLPQHIIEIFADAFAIFYPQDHGYFLGFFVPGENGSVALEDQRLAWAWLRNTPSWRHDELTVDSGGKKLEYSMYEGGLRIEEKVKLEKEAKQLLPQVLVELVEATQYPYFQSIVDVLCPQTVFGNIILLGDAACVVRPQTGSGALKAFEDAVSLAVTLKHHNWNLKTGLPHWEEQQLAYAQDLVSYGKSAAARAKLGWQFH